MSSPPADRSPGALGSPTPSGRIRVAAGADLARLASFVEGLPGLAWTAESLARELGRDDSRIWLASESTDAAALGILIARRVLDELHVFEVAVASDHRRRGLGRALVGAALEWAVEAGLRSALLELRASNRAALALYRACGFVEVGRRPRYYPAGEDALLMTLEPLEVESQRESRLPVRANAEVLENRAEGGANYRLLLEVPDWPGAEPGQFVMLSAGARTSVERSDPLLPRPMAVYRGHEPARQSRGGLVEILYKASGRGTRLIAETLPGQHLRLVGPLGRSFPAVEAGSAAILVGGGTGVASLYELAVRAAGRARLSVLLGARSLAELMGAQDFADLGIDLRITTEDGSSGQRGRVTDALGPLLEQSRGESAPTLYACGPTPMMRACADLAAARGARCLVSLENVMACGFGVCLGCAVPRSDAGYTLVCRSGPVFDAREVCWEGLP